MNIIRSGGNICCVTNSGMCIPVNAENDMTRIGVVVNVLNHWALRLAVVGDGICGVINCRWSLKKGMVDCIFTGSVVVMMCVCVVGSCQWGGSRGGCLGGWISSARGGISGWNVSADVGTDVSITGGIVRSWVA